MFTTTYKKCFLCFENTNGNGLQLSSDEASSFILYNILELPHYNLEYKKLNIMGVIYCQSCSNQITNINDIFEELEGLENNIINEKNKIICKLKESLKKSKNEQNQYVETDPIDKFRNEIVNELTSNNILSMLTKIKENQVAKKFCKIQKYGNVQLDCTNVNMQLNRSRITEEIPPPIQDSVNVTPVVIHKRPSCVRIVKNVSIPDFTSKKFNELNFQNNSTEIPKRKRGRPRRALNLYENRPTQTQIIESHNLVIPDSNIITEVHSGIFETTNTLEQFCEESEQKHNDELISTNGSHSTSASEMELCGAEDEFMIEEKIIPNILSSDISIILPNNIQSSSKNQLTVSSYRLSGNPINSPNEGKQKYVCGTCGLIFSNYDLLKKHDDKLHTKDNNSSSSSSAQLKIKSSSKLLRRPLKKSRDTSNTNICNECGKIFRQPASLKYHIMKQHRGESRIQCPICGFGLMCQSHLRAHIASRHSNERNFKCHVCNASYKSQRHLTIHFRKHTGEKPYQCKLCCERFMDSTVLRRHERKQHADEYGE